MKRVIQIMIVAGVEGPSIYIADQRVAGPKPWGGGRTTNTFNVEIDTLKDAIAEFEQSAKPETR